MDFRSVWRRLRDSYDVLLIFRNKIEIFYQVVDVAMLTYQQRLHSYISGTGRENERTERINVHVDHFKVTLNASLILDDDDFIIIILL